jgi:hypothetical protein
MKGDLLPDNDHVVRYVRPGLIDGEEVTGDAFHRKEGEPAPSINWLDHFRNQPKEQQLREVRRLFRLQVRPKGRFAELNVGQTRRHLADELEALNFIEDPLAADPVNGHDEDLSHALIEGLPDPSESPEFAEMIGDMIAECVVGPLHRATEE